MIDSFARCLCILRRFRDELLEALSSHQVFQNTLTVDPDRVFAFLEAHQSVSNFAGFRETESVIRLVYSAALRMRNPTIYSDCHKAAAEEWKKIVCTTTSTGQDQILYYKEFLYHTASYLALDDLSPTDHWNTLRQEIGSAPLKHPQSYPGGIGADLLNRIVGVPDKYENDEELVELLRESLGSHYDQFKKLLKSVG
jgi:hypothetical protein